jgi:acyl carrier protein
VSQQELYNILIKSLKAHIESGALPARLKNIDFQQNMHIDDLAIDSIDLVELLARLMDETDSYFPDTLFSENPTLWEIAKRISEVM